MISQIEADKLRQIIGTRFSTDIIKILAEYGIVNPKGNPYSDRYISHVLNGKYENQGIEMAFYELAERKFAVKKKIEKQRKKIATKKPEATTPGSN